MTENYAYPRKKHLTVTLKRAINVFLDRVKIDSGKLTTSQDRKARED